MEKTLLGDGCMLYQKDGRAVRRYPDGNWWGDWPDKEYIWQALADQQAETDMARAQEVVEGMPEGTAAVARPGGGFSMEKGADDGAA